MKAATVLAALRGPLERAKDDGNEAILVRFESLLEELGRLADDPAAPERLREKADAFLDVVVRAHEAHDERLFQPAWTLNVCGEALGRTRFLHQTVIDLIQVGLYFWGLDQIERKWSRQAGIYSGLHAEAVMEQVSRPGLKGLIAEAEEKLAEGKVFCLTYSYLNRLRKAYWEYCRESQDALDHAQGEEELQQLLEPRSVVDAPLEQRLDVIMRVFESQLTVRQQWIYLAKNRGSLDPAAAEAAGAEETFEQMLHRLTEPVPDDRLGWAEIAARLGINEKTAKREYLRGLLTLLRQTGEALFGPTWVPTGLVRRVLEQLQGVVLEKDLRLKNSTGRGMGPLVEKWQVALRFVLNSERVSA